MVLRVFQQARRTNGNRLGNEIQKCCKFGKYLFGKFFGFEKTSCKFRIILSAESKTPETVIIQELIEDIGSDDNRRRDKNFYSLKPVAYIMAVDEEINKPQTSRFSPNEPVPIRAKLLDGSNVSFVKSVILPRCRSWR